MNKRQAAKNVLLIDSDYDEADGCVKGLEETTGEHWDVALYENNKIYGAKRYLKFFTVAFRTLLEGKKYAGKTVLCWQQFYGIAIAFFSRLLHVKKRFKLVIMTFIYKPKSGLTGNIFYRFVRYAVTSKYVDKIILTTKSEKEMYKEIFEVSDDLFGFARCGAVAYEPEQFKDPLLKGRDYIFSTGRSNRDYTFLMDSIADTDYHLIIACDSLEADSKKNIEIRRNLFGKDMLRYMKNARAVVIALEDDRIAAGQLVLLHAMNMGVPVIITRSHGVTDDYVIDGYNGLVIEKSKESLLEALDKIFHDEELYCRLSENGQREFESHYTYYAMGKTIGEIVKTI